MPSMNFLQADLSGRVVALNSSEQEIQEATDAADARQKTVLGVSADQPPRELYRVGGRPRWIGPVPAMHTPAQQLALDNEQAQEMYRHLADHEFRDANHPVYLDHIPDAGYWMVQRDHHQMGPNRGKQSTQILLNLINSKITERVQRANEFLARHNMQTNGALIWQHKVENQRVGNNEFLRYYQAQTILDFELSKLAIAIPASHHPDDESRLNAFRTAIAGQDKPHAIMQLLNLAEFASDSALTMALAMPRDVLRPEYVSHLTDALQKRFHYRSLYQLYQGVFADTGKQDWNWFKSVLPDALSAALMVSPDAAYGENVAENAETRLRQLVWQYSKGHRQLDDEQEKELAEQGYSKRQLYLCDLRNHELRHSAARGRYATVENHTAALSYLKANYRVMDAIELQTFFSKASWFLLEAVMHDAVLGGVPALRKLIDSEMTEINEHAAELAMYRDDMAKITGQSAGERAGFLAQLVTNRLLMLLQTMQSSTPDNEALLAIRSELHRRRGVADHTMPLAPATGPEAVPEPHIMLSLGAEVMPDLSGMSTGLTPPDSGQEPATLINRDDGLFDDINFFNSSDHTPDADFESMFSSVSGDLNPSSILRSVASGELMLTDHNDDSILF